jgi:hypothetical protein
MFVKYSKIPHKRNFLYNWENVEGKDTKILLNVSEKIHGTNAGVGFNNQDGLWVQSRNRVLGLGKEDSHGCTRFVEDRRTMFKDYLDYLAVMNNIDFETHSIVVYFELCGGKIAQKTCVTGLDKRMIMFPYFYVVNTADYKKYLEDIKDMEKEDAEKHPREIKAYVHPNTYHGLDRNVFRLVDMDSCSVNQEIKLGSLPFYIEAIEGLLERNEKASFIGKYFGIEDNIMEGFVLSYKCDDVLYQCKIKGEEHEKTEKREPKPIDPHTEHSIKLAIEAANEFVTNSRLEQFDQDDFKKFSNELIEDIQIEERVFLDKYTEQGMDEKHFKKEVCKAAAQWKYKK